MTTSGVWQLEWDRHIPSFPVEVMSLDSIDDKVKHVHVSLTSMTAENTLKQSFPVCFLCFSALYHFKISLAKQFHLIPKMSWNRMVCFLSTFYLSENKEQLAIRTRPLQQRVADFWFISWMNLFLIQSRCWHCFPLGANVFFIFLCLGQLFSLTGASRCQTTSPAHVSSQASGLESIPITD